MTLQETCKSCKYSRGLLSSPSGWCSLRKIKLNSDIAGFAFCHHWAHKEPSLPSIKATKLMSDTQLDFDRDLIIN